MNSLKGIIILVVGSFVSYLLLSFDFWHCPFDAILNIKCPACGMTRAFRALLNFDIVDSLRFNLLAIPLLITIVYLLVLLIFSIIKNTNIFMETTYHMLSKYYKIILALLAFNTVVNNVIKK